MSKALDRFARLVVDVSDRDPERGRILEGLGIRVLPTLVFFDAEGEESGRLTGVVPPARIVAAAEQAASR